MEPLRFLHIPKTAGSTFTGILKRQYCGERCFYFSGDFSSDIERYNELSENKRHNITLFIGHAPIETGISSADNATIITFLRDPISRVKSFCQHVSEGKSNHFIDTFPPETFSIDDFLESGTLELSNLQTKMLINYGDCTTSLLLDDLSDREAINAAADNLFNKISYFGIQEYFDASLIILSSALNWKMPFYISKNKKNTKKLIEFEDRHLKRIEELNSLDLEVYRTAKEKFILSLNSEEFNKAKLRWFQLINAPRGFIIKSKNRPVWLIG